MPLTTEQVAKARTFPGCGDITADNAVEKLFAAAENLQKDSDEHAKASDANEALTAQVGKLEGDLKTAQSQIPRQVEPSILSLVATSAETLRDAAIDMQAVSPACAKELSALLIGDPEKSQYNAAALSSSTGKPLAISVFETLKRNGKAPGVGKEPGGQPAPRISNGAPDNKDVGAEATAEAQAYQARQLASRGMK